MYKFEHGAKATENKHSFKKKVIRQGVNFFFGKSFEEKHAPVRHE